MPLPIQPLPMIERWDCHQCGVCCRGSIVPLSEDDVARLIAQKWHERPEFRNNPAMVRTNWLGHEYRLAHKSDGSCVFLTEDGLCRIHKELGFEAKPLICRMFPLQLVPRDKEAVLTIRRACPSAAADKGRPVAEHLKFAKERAREGNLASAAPHAPPIKSGELREWPVARRMLETCQRLLTDERFPPVRRLVHGLIFCNLVQRARTQSLTDERLTELFEVLENNVAEEVGEQFSNRRPPGSAARVLFRQTAAEFVRLHPGLDIKPSWGERWRLARAAWKFIRGRGELPSLHPSFPPATFEQLEQPLGVLEPGIYQPLNRMIETTAASWVYALANRNGWSIIDSLRILALTYPIGLWLLRWRAAGGLARPEYMPEIITALDRGQGYAPLAGSRQRRRVQILARLEELERLVVWYAR
jgi:lysine-N-methylase